MADQTPAIPEQDQLVTTAKLQQALWAGRISTSAFGGLRNPSSIWQRMVLGDGSAIPLYRELEDKDDDISSALDELKLSVLEREWSVTPGDDSQAALDARDFAQAQLNGIDLDASLDSMLDAAAYGFSVAELMYESSMGQASLLSIDDAPQELFLFGDRFTPQVGPLQILDQVAAGSGALAPEAKFAVFTYRGRARNRMGRPLLQRAFWPSWFKRQVLGLWLKCAEKNNGTAIARYADQASDSDRAFAVSVAEAMVDSAAFAIPANMEYDGDLLKATQSRDPAIYEKLFTQMQYAIARAIKGETLTSFGGEGGIGSKGQGETHADTFDKRSVSLAKKLNQVVSKQVLGRLHLWNFGPNVPPPVFAFDTAEEEDLTRKLALISGAQRLGIPIPAAWAAAALEIPPVSDGELVLVPNAAAPTEALPNAAFAEPEDPLEAQYAEFDRMSAELRKDALALLTERTDEITSAYRRGR